MANHVDERRFRQLMEESQDLHSDAMRSSKDPLNEIVALGHERRGLLPYAAADDVAALQTAASLENLAVATYGVALTLDFIGGSKANGVVKAFALKTKEQHAEHAKAFNAKAKELGGQEQTQANPKYLAVVNAAKPTLKGPADVVGLAIALENVATQTYVANISLVSDAALRSVFASVAGVESQHLATLRAVQALLAGGAPQLISLDAGTAGKLPAAAGSVAFPDAFLRTDMASPVNEGAVA